MQGGESQTPESPRPGPDTSLPPPAPPDPKAIPPIGVPVHHPPTSPRPKRNTPPSPVLPTAEPKRPPPMVEPVRRAPESSAWYRSDQERQKSLYRKANPWYRRLGRVLIGLGFVALFTVGLYLGAGVVRDWLDRDDLPTTEPDIPDVRATSFQISSTSPGPVLDGTLTLDAETGAYEFVGRAGGPQAGLQVASPDGSTIFVRRDTGDWQNRDIDGVGVEAQRAVRYLRDAHTADSVLTNRVRRGFVDIVDHTTEGLGADRLDRFELTIDTSTLSTEFPLQWDELRQEAIPGVSETRTLPVTIWVDQDDILVRLRVGGPDDPFWSWQRLTYSGQPFVPVDPATGSTAATSADVVDVALGLLPCSPAGADRFFTALESCTEALTAGRALAVASGLADADDPAAAEIVFAAACRAIQNRAAVQTALPNANVELAAQLHGDRVCPGELERLETDDS